ARNRGLAEASHAVVAFVDDDAAPAPDWARRLAAAFADPGVGCAGGACRPDFAAPRPGWLSDRLLQFAGITRIGDTPREARSSAEYPFGANLAMRADALREAGGFSERLGRVAAAGRRRRPPGRAGAPARRLLLAAPLVAGREPGAGGPVPAAGRAPRGCGAAPARHV